VPHFQGYQPAGRNETVPRPLLTNTLRLYILSSESTTAWSHEEDAMTTITASNGSRILGEIKTRRFRDGRKQTNTAIAAEIVAGIASDVAEYAEAGRPLQERVLADHSLLRDCAAVLLVEGPEWTDISVTAYNWLASGEFVSNPEIPVQYQEA
jgi:hypothetical protein